MTKVHEEYQYLNLIQNILINGHIEKGRNGETISLFGASMRFTLQNNSVPIFTTKKVAWKTCVKELLWFIRGETDNNLLNEQNVHIWDDNSSKEFMASRGLNDYTEGLLGPIYGFQWRHFNAKYDPYTGLPLTDGIDQLQEIINLLKNPNTRTSRRLIMTAWNPCQLDEMALPPCHVLCQFNVHDGNKLSCSLYQRSGDMGLGVPFNVASYSFLTHILAKHCGLEAYEFIYFLGNAHIYNEHVTQLQEQISRVPFQFPSLEIIQIKENINDYNELDFIISNYKHHHTIKMKMIA
jgi:thymidylate synthase